MKNRGKFQWGYSSAKYLQSFCKADFFSLRIKAPSMTKTGKEFLREHNVKLDFKQTLELKFAIDETLEAYKQSQMRKYPNA